MRKVVKWPGVGLQGKRHGLTSPSAQGDNINGFDVKDRKWDPERLLLGYWHSAAALNYLRSYAQHGDRRPLRQIDLSELSFGS